MELVPSVKRDDVLSRSWKEQKFPLAMCNTMTFKMRLQTIVAAVVPRLYYCYEHVGYDDEAVSVKELVDAFENEDKTPDLQQARQAGRRALARAAASSSSSSRTLSY